MVDAHVEFGVSVHGGMVGRGIWFGLMDELSDKLDDGLFYYYLFNPCVIIIILLLLSISVYGYCYYYRI